MLQGTRFLSACPILCFFIACSWCFLFKLVACRKLYVKYDMAIVSMAFLNIVLLLSIPYFDVRVLTIALCLCAYMLHLEAQLICHTLSLKLYYFSFDMFYLFLKKLSQDFVFSCWFSVTLGFVLIETSPSRFSTQVRGFCFCSFPAFLLFTRCSQTSCTLQTVCSGLALHCIIISNQNGFRWFNKQHWIQLLSTGSMEAELV